MRLGGEGSPLWVILALLAAIALVCAASMRVQAQDPAFVPVRDCSAQLAIGGNGAIFGRTFIDHNRDGAFQPDPPYYEVPEEGIMIQLTHEGVVIGSVLSDADGCYAFIGLGPGDYTLETFPDPTSALSRMHKEPLAVDLDDGERREISLRYERLLKELRILYFPIVAR